jgi:predicted DNA binding protein
MPFLETRVRIQHPCPYCDLSVAFPDVEMALWTSTRSDVFHISAPNPSKLQEVLRTMKETIGARKITQAESAALAVTHKAQWDYPPSITGMADRRGLWLIPPTIYFGGYETYRVISPTNDSLRRFVSDAKKFGTVEMLSHRVRDQLEAIQSLGTVPVHLFEGLTDRQLHILVSAIEGGLFELPAKQKMDRIAAREGLSRSTFGEHLRKAEMQVLRNSYAFLKLRDEASEGGRRKPLRRTLGAEGESPVGIASGAGNY